MKRFNKAFFVTLFWKQNKYHKHNVIMHTLKVIFYLAKVGKYKMIPAALLHDIGKPFAAKKKKHDIGYSFKNHEVFSYHLIKNWNFSDYTKNLVKNHYLIRGLEKEKIRNPKKYKRLKRIHDKLTESEIKDLELFLKADDLGKG